MMEIGEAGISWATPTITIGVTDIFSIRRIRQIHGEGIVEIVGTEIGISGAILTPTPGMMIVMLAL
jgi:hypothetical protein